MSGRIVNIDGFDLGPPVEGQPYKTPTPEQIEKRRESMKRESMEREERKGK